MTSVALPVPTIAGTPSSRLTMAAWLVVPPWLVTMPAARFMTGTQSGSVVSVMRIDPSRNCSMSAAVRITQALPAAMAVPMAAPVVVVAAAGFRGDGTGGGRGKGGSGSG